MNRLYYGDNLEIMQQRMKSRGVDLIYLDPPFKSNQDYNILYKTLTGKPVPEQAEAFCDTWEMDAEKKALAERMPVILRDYGVQDYYAEFWRLWIKALSKTQPHLLSYLTYMVRRILHMKVLLKSTGSIYLHCDPTASHYIKIMMDAIFGHNNFRSEIIWKRTSAHSSAKRYGPVHDVILFYTKSDKYTWNRLYQPYEDRYVEQFYTHVDDDGRRWRRSDLTGAGIRHGETGEPWRGIDVTAKGRHWAYPPSVLEEMDKEGKIHWPAKKGGMPMLKRYLEEQPGVPLQDVWTDVTPMHNLAKERLGYPTQKPIELLKRIIETSSNPGDVIFDPFCGCGTTIYAAHETGREWVGCDIAILAIRLVKEVLRERYRLAESAYKVEGIPASAEQAIVLFESSRTQFQTWAVERAGGFPSPKKVADRGIDGRIYFETYKGLRSMVISVKGGAIKPGDIRDLRGVLEREEDAELAGFISNRKPTKAMKQEAASAGVYEYNGVEYPRIQLMTAQEMMEDKREFDTPTKMGATKISTGQVLLPYR